MYALIRSPRCVRPNKPSAALAHNSKVEAESKAKAAMHDKKLKGQANLLTRIPSLRYRFHPYQRDDRVRQAAEAGEVERVREALGRSFCVGVYSYMCVRASRHIRVLLCGSMYPRCNDWHSISSRGCAFSSFADTAVCQRTHRYLCCLTQLIIRITLIQQIPHPHTMVGRRARAGPAKRSGQGCARICGRRRRGAGQ